jgi:hypothetical protein
VKVRTECSISLISTWYFSICKNVKSLWQSFKFKFCPLNILFPCLPFQYTWSGTNAG